MSIKLGYIELENYGSFYGKHRLSFKEKQGNLVSILGINEIDGSSNGAGKSTIVDAVVMSFFGRSLKRELNLEDFICNKVPDLTQRLELGFEDSADGIVSHKYVIERIRGKAANSVKCNLYEDGIWITRDKTNTETQNIINKIIGIDYNMFINTNVLNPELFRFVKGNNNDKLDILERTLNLNIIGKIYNNLNKIAGEDQKVHSLVDTELYALKTSLANLKQQSENVNDHIQESINTILSNNEKLQEQINELEIDLRTTEEEVNSLSPEIEKAKKDLLEKKEEEVKLRQREQEHIKIIQYYKNNEKCHTCKQDLPNRISILEEEGKRKKEVSEKIIEVLAEIKDAKNRMDRTDYAEAVIHEGILKTKIREKKYNIEQNNRNIEKFKKITNTSNAGMLEEVTEKIGVTTAEWTRTKEIFEETDFWKELLVPKSQTRMALAADLLKILNTYIQKYVKNFYSKDFKFNFIVKDNNIEEVIYKDGKKMKYDQLSSGERQKVDIVLVVALLDIAMSYFKNNKLKFLIIDEALDHLDPVWGRYVIEFIKQYAIKMNMMCLLISHHGIIDEMNYIFDNKIVVSKGMDDSSHIKN